MKPLSFLTLSVLLMSTSLVHADKVDDLIGRAMKQQQIPGLALAVLRDGKPIKVKAYGLASIDYDSPVKTDTSFLLASMTKSFTATSIMMLVEQGKVRLDAPISTYLEDTPDSWKGITVRNLLSHTAGLKDRFEEVPMDANKWKLWYSEATMFKAATETKVDFVPGEHFQYSDQGFFLLGRIVEKVSGETYPAFLKAHIFDPLGMKNSSTVQLSRIVKGMATGYTLSAGKLLHNTRRTDYGMVSHFGMISNVEDLAKWDEALYGEKLLKHSSIEQMWTPEKLPNGTPYYTAYGGYGLGWFIDRFNGHRSVGHGGSTGTAYLRFPEDKLTIIVLTNLEQIAGGDATGIATLIAREYLPALEWSALKPQADSRPDLTKSLRSALEGLVAGSVDVSPYEPYYGSLVKADAAQQKAALAPLGAISGIESLENIEWGAGRLVRYKVTFKLMPMYGTVLFNPEGKIASLALEPAERYR